MIRPVADRVGALLMAAGLAALCVSGLTQAVVMIGVVADAGSEGLATALGGGLLFGLLAAAYALLVSFVVYSLGLVLVGIPAWWLLHRTGHASQKGFVGIGAVLSVTAGIILFRLVTPGSEVLAPLLAIPGGLAGWALWNWGYSHPRLRPVPPSAAPTP